MPEPLRPLHVFLCHAKEDKPVVRELYQKLAAEGWIDPWLDEEKLLPGQDWDLEIEKAVRAAQAVVVLLSKDSITKEGYVQAEMRFALNIARTKPDETIFVIPLRLDDCQVPIRLQIYQYVDYFPKERKDWAYHRLLASLETRAHTLGIPTTKLEMKPEPPKREEKPKAEPKREPAAREKQPEKKEATPPVAVPKSILDIGLAKAEWGGIEFVKVSAGPFLMGSKEGNSLALADERPQHTVNIPYDYWIARFPVTNEHYAAYVGKGKHPVSDWQKKKDHPVINVSWQDAMAYCKWLNNLLKGRLPQGLILRLPTEAEWEKAARGTDGSEWPWGNEFDKNKCNSDEGGKGDTTPVGLYSPQGDSPYGCADMVGNVWEWTHSLYKPYPYKAKDGRENEKDSAPRVLCGGAFYNNAGFVRCASRYGGHPLGAVWYYRGFRVVVVGASLA
ncbi:MAG: SUMF1/EgtB/PvdO family nonheme iron enzyme [Lentisphaerota bacterium]